MSNQLPHHRLTQIHRLEATLGQPLALGELAPGHRRIVPQTGFSLIGDTVSGASRAWPFWSQ
jgi:hypothetical protein